MIKITFKSNAQGLAKAIEEAAFKQVKEKITKQLARVRCPEHNQYPRVEVSGTSLGSLKWKVVGCCEKLTAEATRALQ